MSHFPHARFLLSVAAIAQFPADSGSEVAIAGRSNAGKSSAINAITQRHSLARTSKTPGQTRLLNYFELREGQRLVDLPGYGYAAVPPAARAQWIPLIDQLRDRRSFTGLFLIVDARRGVGAEDEGVLAWAAKASEPRVHVVLAKADKLSRNEGRVLLDRTRSRLAGQASVQLFSAHARTGIEEAQRTLDQMLEGARTKSPGGLRSDTTGTD